MVTPKSEPILTPTSEMSEFNAGDCAAVNVLENETTSNAVGNAPPTHETPALKFVEPSTHKRKSRLYTAVSAESPLPTVIQVDTELRARRNPRLKTPLFGTWELRDTTVQFSAKALKLPPRLRRLALAASQHHSNTFPLMS